MYIPEAFHIEDEELILEYINRKRICKSYYIFWR